MPESIVQVTEGAGKKLHTFQRVIGTNTVEDEIVTLGEQYLASYVSVASATNANTANSHMLQIMAGASLKVYVRRLRLFQGATLAGAATVLDMQVFRLSTAGTGGTVITPAPYDPGDAASGATSMTLPTVKGTETTLLQRFTMGALAAAPTAGGDATLIWEWDADRLRVKPIIIAAGTANGIAIKNITALATATFHIVADITEANF